MKRRDFFRLMGIVSASAVSACKAGEVDKKLIPFLVPPDDDVMPGEPIFVTSTCAECPAGCGVIVKVRDGKPVKLEGNPYHPVNRGALCIRGQAGISRLYHPQRLKQPMVKKNGVFEPISWPQAFILVKEKLGEGKGAGLGNVMFGSKTTGSLHELAGECCDMLDIERFPAVELIHHGAIRQANGVAFGIAEVPHFRLDRCDFLFTLGADLLGTFLSPVEWSRQLHRARREDRMQWYHAEPYLTLTGANATRRLTIQPGSEWCLLGFLLHCLPARKTLPAALDELIPAFTLNQTAEATGIPPAELVLLLQGLSQARSPLLIAGGPATAHNRGGLTALLSSLLQWKLGMTDGTLDFTHGFNDDFTGTFKDVLRFEKSCRDRENGVVLLMDVPNVCSRPQFLEALEHCRYRVAIGFMGGPLMEACDMVLPLSHPLETWGDVVPRRGLRSLIQPAVEPLFASRGAGDILLGLMGEKITYQRYLAQQWGDVTEVWIREGVREEETALLEAVLDMESALPALRRLTEDKLPTANGGASLLVAPSLRTYDGRGSDIPLLAEIPDPMIAVSYGPYAVISADIAGDRGILQGDILRFEGAFGSLELPVVFGRGIATGTVVVPIEFSGCFSLPGDPVTGEWCLSLKNVRSEATGLKIRLPILAGEMIAGGMGILPEKENNRHKYKRHSLYPPHQHKNYRWGMVVDLDACTGCSACVAACYIENNIPVVGEKEHLKGREMSWLRIEPYFDDGSQPEFVPMLCQQCDCAPCETVCPVYATYHNPEGLNAQIYNRCVGTRYCANNCPYKVRRFNWFDNKGVLPLFSVSNPDLSVRPKGVMEKCTFCIQRIRFAKDRAAREKRGVMDGEVIPACAQTCPTGAITFGNLLDPGSRVARLASSSGAYRVLEQLGTEPAVFYIKRRHPEETTKS